MLAFSHKFSESERLKLTATLNNLIGVNANISIDHGLEELFVFATIETDYADIEYGISFKKHSDAFFHMSTSYSNPFEKNVILKNMDEVISEIESAFEKQQLFTKQKIELKQQISDMPVRELGDNVLRFPTRKS